MKKSGFSLVEIMISVTIFSIMLIIAFEALGNIGKIRVNNVLKINLSQDLHYSVENLVATIKDFNGDIDYEEYFNRTSVGTATSSGHYTTFSGFGNYGKGGAGTNYGEGFYYCRSPDSMPMGTGGCINNAFNSNDVSMLGEMQRYGQYQFQFIDYNSNQNNDSGDEDGDLDIRGDDDDENIGIGPYSFSGNSVKELYLIKKGDTYERLFLRFNKKRDPFSPPSYICDDSATASGCIGNIQTLKLVGQDEGYLHDGTLTGAFDGIVDTWRCESGFSCDVSGILTTSTGGWLDLFPEYINVKDFKMFVYPNKDFKYAWKENDNEITINPYIRLNLVLGYSWMKKKNLNKIDPTVSISTTINLTRN